MNNKKGQIIEGLVDAASIVAFFITVLLFFSLFQIKGCGSSTSLNLNATNGEEIESNNLLLTYLRLPVEMNNKNITMGGLITEWFLTNNKTYKKEIKEETKDFLDFMPHCSEINVYHDKKGFFANNLQPILTVTSKYCDNKNYDYVFACSTMYLPRQSQEKNLKVSACVEESKIDKTSATVVGP